MNINSLYAKIIAALIFVFFLGVTGAYAITVTSVTDDGSGGVTLREAIEMANSNPGPDVINFNIPLSNTITLTMGDIEITDDLTINGPGANRLTISGNYNDRIFTIENNSEEIDVSISGLRFEYGSAELGGAIYNAENLDIDSCIFEENEALDGGAIHNGGEFVAPCVLNITNTQFIGNYAEGNGGAIHNIGTIGIIDNCEFIDNQAGSAFDEWLKSSKDSQVLNGILSFGNGGAIFNTFSHIGHSEQNTFVDGSNGGVIEHISNTLFKDNSAIGSDGFDNCDVTIDTANVGVSGSGFGGAIFNGASIDIIETSAFIGNEASVTNNEYVCQTANGQTAYVVEGVSLGGAIFSEYVLNLIRNCTFYDNTANDGGALYFSASLLNSVEINGDGEDTHTPTLIDFCTITENTGTGLVDYVKVGSQNALTSPNDEVGGIATGNGIVTVQLSNSIVANQNQGFDCDEEGIQSLGNNIDSDGTCTGGPGDMTTINVGLDPDGPQDNGGSTPTIALCVAAGNPPGCTMRSPAINNAGDCDIENDQRIFVRADPFDNLCDIGAYEANSFAVGRAYNAPTLSQYGMILIGILTIISVILFRREKLIKHS